MEKWLIDNLVGIIGTLVAGFVAYHVYFLSKRIGLQEKLRHKEQISVLTNSILMDMHRNNLRKRVELINTKKYVRHYPHSNELTWQGYTYLGAELKATRYDGVEFFAGMPVSVYETMDGKFSLRKKHAGQERSFIVYPVGLIPYDWIEYVDRNGDEFSYRPQFFAQFRGPKKFPYKGTTYYRESETYEEGRDPHDMKYQRVDVIS